MRTIERNCKSELEEKLITPASCNNDINTDIVVDVVYSIFNYLHTLLGYNQCYVLRSKGPNDLVRRQY